MNKPQILCSFFVFFRRFSTSKDIIIKAKKKKKKDERIHQNEQNLDGVGENERHDISDAYTSSDKPSGGTFDEFLKASVRQIQLA